MFGQERSDPKYAGEIIAALWPDKRLRCANMEFLADSIRFAHSQGSAAWEVTLFKDLIRLNVGQVAVLDLRGDTTSVYCRAPLRLPKQPGIHHETKWRSYAAIPEPTELYRVDPKFLDDCPVALRAAHLALITAAATRKRRSPFKQSFSEGVLAYLEEELGTRLDRPSYLERTASSELVLPETIRPETIGGGFGTCAENREVEKAAVTYVTEWYQLQGWTVTSVESKKIGYDLLCERASLELHVEVKGTNGNGKQFILTAGEFETGCQDGKFILALVTHALSEKPHLQQWKAKEFREAFTFNPIQYWARLVRA